MSKVYETLKKKNDTSVEVYPNIERTNIPDGAINTAKVEDRAITFNKLSDSLQTDITRFNDIYDEEEDELNVSGLNVTDDIHCSNINVDNKVNASDIESSNSIKSPEYYDADDDKLKVIVNHCIYANLVNRDDATDTRYILMHFVSSKKESITTFSELLDELSKKIGISIIDNNVNVVGWLSGVNINNGFLSMYVDDRNGGVDEVDFNSAISIQDDVYPI